MQRVRSRHMIRIYRAWPPVGAALASLAAAAPGAAQTASQPAATPASQPASASSPSGKLGRPNANTVEQIVVTANKRREYQRQVANSVTAISGQDLARRQQVSLQDLAAQVPGLSLEADDKTAVRIVLRGLNTGSPGATVATVIDDVPTNATGGQTNAATNSPNYDTYDLQRIEVLRGPQSSLYGATAEGGLVKYVTNAPDPTAYSGSLEAGIQGNTDGGIGGALRGFGNFPLLDGKAALRVSAWNDWFPGYVDDPERGKTNVNSAQQYGWRASLLVTPTADLTIRLTAERQTLISNAEDDIEVAGAALTPLTPPANQLDITRGLINNTALPTPSQNESGVYYGSINYDFGWATATSLTSYAYNNFRSLFDFSSLNIAPGVTYADYLQEAAYGVPVDLGERQNSNGDKFNQEIRLASDPGLQVLGRDLNWLGGFYYTHENTSFLQGYDVHDAANPASILTQPLPGGQIDQFSSLSEWAVFGQVDYTILHGFDVALGGRFSGTAQRAQTINFAGALSGAAGVDPELGSNDHDALYSVAPRWRPNDDTLFYARLATGYRPGGPNILIPGLTTEPPAFQPDHTVNYELGWRQDLFHKSVTVDLTGFYINWRNVQITSEFNTPEGVFSVDGNAGAAVSKGVEWSFNWVPLPGLKLNAVGDYTDARLTVNAAGLGGAAGDFLPYVPNLSSSVNVEYSWAAFADYDAYVSGTWSYTGERYTGFSATPSVVVSHVLLPGYHTGALRAGLENRRYSLEAFINNISDSRGIGFYQSYGGADQTGQATIIQPRIIGLTARVKF